MLFSYLKENILCGLLQVVVKQNTICKNSPLASLEPFTYQKLFEKHFRILVSILSTKCIVH